MIIPRELIYEDRKDLKEFGVYDETLNHRIYLWLLERPELEPEKTGIRERRLAAFNDAYYICTIILMVNQCEHWIPYYMKETRQPSVVLPMVYCYLTQMHIEQVLYLTKTIETYASTDNILRKNIEDIKTVLENWEGSIPLSLFNRRKLTVESLSKIQWGKITNGFKTEDIKRIVRNVVYDEDEQKMIAEAVKNAAQLAEDEFYNPQPYVDDYNEEYEPSPDENSCWTPDYSETYKLCDMLMTGKVYQVRHNNKKALEDYSESIAKLKERILELEAENRQLKDMVEMLNTDLGDFEADSKIGLTLVMELMKNDGANFEKSKNKTIATKALCMMTGRSGSLCKSMFSNPLSKTYPPHKKKIEELNALLERLGMNTHL